MSSSLEVDVMNVMMMFLILILILLNVDAMEPYIAHGVIVYILPDIACICFPYKPQLTRILRNCLRKSCCVCHLFCCRSKRRRKMSMQGVFKAKMTATLCYSYLKVQENTSEKKTNFFPLMLVAIWKCPEDWDRIHQTRS